MRRRIKGEFGIDRVPGEPRAPQFSNIPYLGNIAKGFPGHCFNKSFAVSLR